MPPISVEKPATPGKRPRGARPRGSEPLGSLSRAADFFLFGEKTGGAHDGKVEIGERRSKWATLKAMESVDNLSILGKLRAPLQEPCHEVAKCCVYRVFWSPDSESDAPLRARTLVCIAQWGQEAR